MNKRRNGRRPGRVGQVSDFQRPEASADASETSVVIAPVGGLTVETADEPVLRARDELRQVTQSEIDRVVAAYEAWLVDVQTTFPNRIGPKLLSYAIQQTFRAWELIAPSQANAEASPAPKPGQGDALMFPTVPTLFC